MLVRVESGNGGQRGANRGQTTPYRPQYDSYQIQMDTIHIHTKSWSFSRHKYIKEIFFHIMISFGKVCVVARWILKCWSVLPMGIAALSSPDLLLSVRRITAWVKIWPCRKLSLVFGHKNNVMCEILAATMVSSELGNNCWVYLHSMLVSSQYIPTVVAEEGGEGNSGWKDRGLH